MGAAVSLAQPLRQGTAELRFARRAGGTVLVSSRVTAPMAIVRPFPLEDGRQLVQLVTLGPGFCGGDRITLHVIAEDDADVVVTTSAATRVLSMRPGQRAEQQVRITAARGATIQYYPLPTIPFPASEFVQSIAIDADGAARVGVLETFAMGRVARDEYLQFRAISNRTSMTVDGSAAYLDATELRPGEAPLTGVGVLAGRRYVASGFWHGVTLADTPREGACTEDLLIALAQSRPGLCIVRALANDAVALKTALHDATARVAAAWGHRPLLLDRFHC